MKLFLAPTKKNATRSSINTSKTLNNITKIIQMQNKKKSKRNNNQSEQQLTEEKKKISFNSSKSRNSKEKTQAQIINAIREMSLEVFKASSFKSVNFYNWLMMSIILMTETTFFFSSDFSKIYEKELNYKEKIQVNFLTKNSFINVILNYFSVIERMRFLTPNGILTILGIFIAIKMSIVLLFWWTPLIENFVFSFRDNYGNIKLRGFFLTLVYLYFRYFDAIFFIANYLGISSLFCRWIEVPVTDGGEEDLLTTSIKNDYAEILGNFISEQNEEFQVHFLSDQILCSNNEKFKVFLNVFGIVLIGLNLCLKLIFNNIWCFTPSISIPQSKYGNADLAIDIVTTLGILFRILVGSVLRVNHTTLKFFVLLFFILLLTVSLLMRKQHPFYNKKFASIKKLQISYPLTVSAVYLIISYQLFGATIFEKEFSAIGFFLITISISFRLAANTKLEIDPYTIIEKLTSSDLTKKELSKKELLTIYYNITKFIHMKIESKKFHMEMDKEANSINLMINVIFQWHRSNCRQLNCLCHGNNFRKYAKRLPLYIALNNQIFNSNDFVLKGLLICEELMRKRAFKKKETNMVLFCSYVEFLIRYMGKPITAKKSIHHGLMMFNTYKRNSKKLKIVEFEILKDLLDKMAQLNQMNGTLAMNSYHELIYNQRGKEDVLDVQKHISFLNSMENLKSLILHCAEYQLKFIESLRETPSSEKIFEFVAQLSREKANISAISEKLLTQSRGLYAPLLSIMWKFLKDVSEDYISSSGYLTLFQKISKKSFSNLNNIFYNIETLMTMRNYEYCSIYISGEENTLQKIKYCTSNLFDYTGWKNHELVGMNLEKIIPEPFRSMHKHLIQERFFSGVFLTQNKYRNIVCLSRLGELKPFKLTVRINHSISMDLQFVGIMQFENNWSRYSTKDPCIAVTDTKGIIKSVSKPAKELFSVGQSIFSSNKAFKVIYKGFDEVGNQHIAGSKVSGNFYEIFEEKKKKKAWKMYLKWSKFNSLRIRKKTVKLKIQDYVIPKVNGICRFVIVEQIGEDKIFKNFDIVQNKQTPSEIKEDVKEKRNLRSMLLDKDEVNFESSGSFDEENIELISEGPRAQTTRTINSMIKNSLYSMNREVFSDRKKSNSSKVKNYQSFQQGFQGFGIQEKDEDASEEEKIIMEKKISETFQNNIEKKRSTENEIPSSERKNFSNFLARNFENSSIKFENPESLCPNQSKAKENVRHDQEKDELSKKGPLFKLSRLVHHHPGLSLLRGFNQTVKSNQNICKLVDSNINYNGLQSTKILEKSSFGVPNLNLRNNSKLHTAPKFAFMVLTLIFIVNIYANIEKFNIQKESESEIPLALIGSDIFCWVTWVQLYGIISLEGNRAVREGWIGEYDMMRFINNNSYWEDTYQKQGSSEVWTFVDYAQKSLDQKVRNFQQNDLYRGQESFFQDPTSAQFYEVQGSSDLKEGPKLNTEKNKGLITGEQDIKWVTNEVSRHDALKLLQLAGEIYVNRNYQNDSLEDIPSLGENRDRNKDYFEEFMRKLLIGETLYKVMIRGWDIYEYLKDLCRRNEDSILFSSVLGAGGSAFLLFVLFLYFLNLRSRMNKFYALAFSLKVDELDSEIENYKKKMYKLRYLLVDERCSEYQNKNLKKFKNFVGFFKGVNNIFSKSSMDKTPKSNVNFMPKKKTKKSAPTPRVIKRDITQSSSLNRTTKINRIRLKSSNYSFRLTPVFIGLLSLVVLFSAINLLTYITFNPRVKRATNLAKVYISGVESWNAYFILHAAVIETIFYNNTVVMWNGVSSYDFYFQFREKTKSYIIQNLTESASYDLGNFTQKYRLGLTTGNSCETIFHFEEQDKKDLPHCYEWYDGLMGSNFLNSLKGIMTSLDRLINEWEQKRNSWEEVDEIFQSPTFLAIMGKMRRIWIVSYYWASVPASNILKQQLIDDSSFMKIFDNFYIGIISVLMLVIYKILVLNLQDIMIIYRNTLREIPLRLIMSNTALRSVLEKVQDRKKRIT